MGEYDLLGRSRYSGESQTFMGGGNQSDLLLCGRVQSALPSGLDQQHQEHSARGIVLGKGFLYVDLVRYTAGILLAYVVDSWFKIDKSYKPGT